MAQGYTRGNGLATPVSEKNGGTAQSTYTTGDILYASASDTLSKLAVGSNGEVLTLAAGVPSWAAASAGGVTGPGSSTDNALARWNGTGGDTLQDSSVIVSDNGEMTNASQPAFNAYQGTTDANVTGDGTAYVLGNTDVGTTLTERFDQNSDFTPGASGGAVFTAPVTGKYQFNFFVLMKEMTVGTDTMALNIITSNKTYTYGAVGASSSSMSVSCSIICDMDAEDTATFRVVCSGGAKDVDIFGNATVPRTVVSGFLVC